MSAGAFAVVEPSRAPAAVDIKTGPDASVAAGLKAKLALACALGLRCAGGGITLDPAPVPRRDRNRVERAPRAAFREDGAATAPIG